MVRAVFPLIFATCACAQDEAFYNQQSTTVLGCTCKTACQTSPIFMCRVDEFCSVMDENCPGGKAAWSATHGSYDWCKYEPYMPYESGTAADKQAQLLDRIARDTTPGAYPDGPVALIKNLVGESVMMSFDAVADVFPRAHPNPRVKVIHSVGVAGGIKFESYGGHPYTGLFEEGAPSGVVRFSSAAAPGESGFTPGMGIKLLRDGRQSANFVAMYTLDGQPAEDNDFFEHEWSTHVPTASGSFGLKVTSAKFWQASYCPQKVGISDLATSSDDVPAARGSFPFQLIFKPTAKSPCDSMDYPACLDTLSQLSPGTMLFEVIAVASPGADQQAIGSITLTSQLSTSAFGDNELFFQHQRMEDDFAIHPEWLESIDKLGDCGMTRVSTEWPRVEDGCNSPFDGSTMLSSDVTV